MCVTPMVVTFLMRGCYEAIELQRAVPEMNLQMTTETVGTQPGDTRDIVRAVSRRGHQLAFGK